MTEPTPPTKRGRGQPTKFTPETRHRIITALQAGNYRETACRYAGISHQTLRNWIIKAEDPDAPPEYIEFVEAIEKAEAEAEMVDIGLIRQAAQGGTWQAAAWVRERKNPERWGRRERQQVELSGPEGGPVQVGVAHFVDVTAIEGLALALERRALESAEGEDGGQGGDGGRADGQITGNRQITGLSDDVIDVEPLD